MKRQSTLLATFATLYVAVAWAQAPVTDHPAVPIYRVTVVERTIKAVDYQYRRGPTTVDFRGTVLLPEAKGHASVDSKAGRTEIDAHFEHVKAPTRFGTEYLTYVLWAITPQGHPKNLGEVLADSSDHAKLHVTTDLQAFGMIVTAEPYSAVRQPSDVVIMENEVRPDTVGHIEQVSAKYELMPRGHYTYHVPANIESVPQGEKVSMDRYEEMLEVYQAQNAVQIAKSVGADHYTPGTFGKAERLLKDAQNFQAQGADKSTIITAARHAAQTAEDAREITEARKREEDLAEARNRAAHEQELRAQAEAETRKARSQASADRMQLDDERAAREQAEQRAAAATVTPPPPPAPVRTTSISAHKADLRMSILHDLGAIMDTRDTPRGLVVTVSDSYFGDGNLSSSARASLERVAEVAAAHPGLYVQVDGHTDNMGSASREEQVSYERAAAVRDMLVRSGIPANSIAARGLGSSRPLFSNNTASGRERNRRVEITISGDPIGSLPYWDRSYSLVPRR